MYLHIYMHLTMQYGYVLCKCIRTYVFNMYATYFSVCNYALEFKKLYSEV